MEKNFTIYNIYSMFKNSCPFFYSDFLYSNGQDIIGVRVEPAMDDVVLGPGASVVHLPLHRTLHPANNTLTQSDKLFPLANKV